MQVRIILPLFCSLILFGLVGLVSAQRFSSIPPIAYPYEGGIRVYYPGEDEVYEVYSNAVIDIHPDPRPMWSPDGDSLAYLGVYPDNTSLASLYIDDLHNEDFRANVVKADEFDPVWLPDGRILYASEDGTISNGFAAYALHPEPNNNDLEFLGLFTFMRGCGGGGGLQTDYEYYAETNIVALSLTAYGLLHSGSCGGGYVSLSNLETGESIPLAEGHFQMPVLSADGNRLLGKSNGQLAIVNLADLSFSTYPTASEPQNFVWVDNDNIIYTSYTVTGDILEGYTNAERETIQGAMWAEHEAIPRHEASIYTLNLRTGEENLLYRADAYGVGRMALRGSWLIFSQVENGDDWVAAMANGDVVLSTAYEVIDDLIQTDVYALDMSSLQANLLLENAEEMVVAP